MADSIDLTDLRASARKLLTRAREHKSSAADLWSQTVDAGWLGLCVPEEYGGLGQSFAAAAILCEELGRVLGSHEFVATTLCLQALAGVSDSSGAARELIEKTLAGGARPVFAGGAIAEIEELDGRLSGTIRNVLDAENATHLLVTAGRAQPTLVLIELPQAGLKLDSREAWDSTRHLCDVVVEGVRLQSSRVQFESDQAQRLSCLLATQLDLAIACDAIGGADAIFETTLQYMSVRTQFARPIASFQALKHRCADLFVRKEAARSLIGAATDSLCEVRSDARASAAGSRLFASASYRRITEEAIQLHGGIGFTWEHACHRFLKRARLNDVLGGTPEERKDSVAPALFRGAARQSGTLSAVF